MCEVQAGRTVGAQAVSQSLAALTTHPVPADAEDGDRIIALQGLQHSGAGGRAHAVVAEAEESRDVLMGVRELGLGDLRHV